MDKRFISALHIIFVGPLLILIGMNKIKDEHRQYFLYLGVMLMVYHLYRFMIYSNYIEGMCSLDNNIIHSIKMFDSYPGYDTTELQIAKGEIVIWTNVGETEQTITSIDYIEGDEKNSGFHSNYLKPGASYSIKFDKPGKYYYYSIPNSGWMQGCITVI
jgi:plastocyanin